MLTHMQERSPPSAYKHIKIMSIYLQTLISNGMSSIPSKLDLITNIPDDSITTLVLLLG
jgi:hypothetical protein